MRFVTGVDEHGRISSVPLRREEVLVCAQTDIRVSASERRWEGGRAACTHINILRAMGVILGIFILAGNEKRQPTSNLALSYFL